MKWGDEQNDALRAVAAWMKDPSQQLFRLFGYAGTGKTTLARHFAEGIEGKVMFGAYTGKAAHVLRTKGCADASTIHSMIYHSKEKGRAKLKELEIALTDLYAQLKGEGLSDDEVNSHRRMMDIRGLIAQERKSLARPIFSRNPDSEVKFAKLVVIDECSMVDGQMGEDLLSYGAKVLVLGDPAQLPPVGGGGFFTENVKPDVMLMDIHRQARDNPIIEMATKTRNAEELPIGSYGTSRVIEPKDSNPELALRVDQILVGRNKTRYGSNKRIRTLKGITEDHPIEGDRLVCLRNNHDRGLLNGAIWEVDGVGPVFQDNVFMSISPMDGDGPQSMDVEAHMHHFQGRGEDLPWWEKKEKEEFDYGYALTVHKSQGSQWKDVLLFDESWCFRKDRWRWLYTGITRAEDQVTIIRS